MRGEKERFCAQPASLRSYDVTASRGVRRPRRTEDTTTHTRARKPAREPHIKRAIAAGPRKKVEMHYWDRSEALIFIIDV